MTNNNFTSKQISALSLLLEGKTQKEVSKAVGITRQTLGLWLKQGGFSEKLKSLQQKRIDQVFKDITDLESKATQVVRSILDDPQEKSVVRLRAAELVMKEAARITYFQNLSVRLGAIEDWMKIWESLEKREVDWDSVESQNFNYLLKRGFESMHHSDEIVGIKPLRSHGKAKTSKSPKPQSLREEPV